MQLSEKLYREINRWTEETFGKDRDPFHVLEHLREEVHELEVEIDKYKRGLRKNQEDILMEYADVQILLWNLMGTMKICHNRCMEAVAIKMAQNKKRKWGNMVGNKNKHFE